MLGAAIGNSAMVWAVFLALPATLNSIGLLDFDLRAISRV